MSISGIKTSLTGCIDGPIDLTLRRDWAGLHFQTGSYQRIIAHHDARNLKAAAMRRSLIGLRFQMHQFQRQCLQQVAALIALSLITTSTWMSDFSSKSDLSTSVNKATLLVGAQNAPAMVNNKRALGPWGQF